MKPLAWSSFDTTTDWKMVWGPAEFRPWLRVRILCSVTDDSSDVVGDGQVACQGHAKNLQQVLTSNVTVRERMRCWLVGFRTHLKSMHFHVISFLVKKCLYCCALALEVKTDTDRHADRSRQYMHVSSHSCWQHWLKSWLTKNNSLTAIPTCPILLVKCCNSVVATRWQRV